VFVAAGALFATSAHAARGTDLRAGRRGRLADLVQEEQRLVSERAAAAARLQAEVASQTTTAARRSTRSPTRHGPVTCSPERPACCR
jgi:hypothetical protein